PRIRQHKAPLPVQFAKSSSLRLHIHCHKIPLKKSEATNRSKDSEILACPPPVSPYCLKLLQLIPGKEVSNLERSRILGIRSMDRVLSNRSRELLANRPFISLRRIGRAHQLAQIG